MGTQILVMKCRGNIIVAFILLNIFHNINGRFVRCPHSRNKGLHNLCHAQNDGVHIPHPTDCSKFVQCDKSCAVVKICSNGTAFDDSLGNCNHEYLVNCPNISKKAIADFSNLARSDRKFGGTAPKNPNPNYIEIQMENELKLSKIETEYDDEYAATETTIKPDIELGIDTASEDPETTLKPEKPEVDTVTEKPEIDTVIEESESVTVPEEPEAGTVTEEPEIVTLAMDPETVEVTITPDIELRIDTANEEPEITHENERPRTAQDTVVNWLLETNEVENNFHDANIVPIPYIRTENLQWKK